MLKPTAISLLILLAGVSHATEQTTDAPATTADTPTLPAPFGDVATPANISLDKLNRTIIGTWHCQDTVRLPDGISSYQATLHYKADGTLISRKVSHSTYEDVAGSYTIHTNRRWRIMSSDNDTLWVMVEQINDATHFHLDNDALEDKAQLRAFLASKPTHVSLIALKTQDGTTTLSLLAPLSGHRFAYCHKAGR